MVMQNNFNSRKFNLLKAFSKKHVKKNYMTLIEIMVVMFLIAMIMGVLSYNLKGNLEKGKVFRTQAGKEKIEAILELHVSEYPEDLPAISSKWREILKHSPIVKNGEELSKDGWGMEYRVSADQQSGKITVESDKYNAYQKRSR